MRHFWPLKWPRKVSSAEPRPAGPFPATDTARVIRTIIDEFERFIVEPPSDGHGFGDFADYSCDTPRDRARWGATIYLNRVIPNRSMHELANEIAQQLERRHYRTVIRRGPTGEFELYVPWVFLNSTQ